VRREVGPSSNALQPSAATWSAALADRRRLHFVGRSAELEQLFSARDRAALGPSVASIVGAEGLGKTLLARRFFDEVQAQSGVACWLGLGELKDADDLPAAVAAQGFADLSQLGHSVAPDVLVVDGFDDLHRPSWLLEQTLAKAGPRLCVVTTSRRRLPTRLRSELGVAELALANLSQQEASALLARSGISEALHAELHAFSGGHPLTLVLLAEHFRASPVERIEPSSLVDLFARLSEPAAEPMLDERAFANAVKAALPRLYRTHELKDNPLLCSAVLAASVPPKVRAEAALNPLRAGEALAQLLREVGAALADNPAYASAARVLAATFFDPAAKQEAAAAALRLPYGTYRYQLRAAIRLFTQELWERERAARAGSSSSMRSFDAE
jgi:hypothetical protein